MSMSNFIFININNMDMKRHMLICLFISSSVACAVGPSVNPLQNRETQLLNIVLQCMY